MIINLAFKVLIENYLLLIINFIWVYVMHCSRPSKIMSSFSHYDSMKNACLSHDRMGKGKNETLASGIKLKMAALNDYL